MTAIALPFSGYPDRRYGLTAGTAQIHLDETPRLPTCGLGDLRTPDRPLQRPLRWHIGIIEIDAGFATQPDDLHRWLTGTNWHRIPRLLYAAFLSERGLEDRAAVYRLLDGAA